MDGILIIDKPAGITSHDVVARARRILKTKSIGHTGTLDPFAIGVMVLLVGRATRLARFLDKDEKEYEAVIRFGFETTTGDLTGETKGELRITNYELRIEDVERILPEFLGEIQQTPPMYSAKKIAGKKLYELARKGIEVERQAVKIKIYKLEIQSSKIKVQSTNPEEQFPEVSLRVACSAGTYIRVLAEDIGEKLGTGAHLAALRRTRAGKFDLSQSVTLEKLEELAAENKVSGILVSMNEAVSHLPEKRLTETEIGKVKHGMKIFVENENLASGAVVRLTNEAGDLLAIGFYDGETNFIQPKLVLL